MIPQDFMELMKEFLWIILLKLFISIIKLSETQIRFLQSAKILLLTSKCEIIFAPNLVIALPTLR